MAKATPNFVPPPMPPPILKGVTLELTKEEAVTLLDIARSIGGPEHSRRRYADAIRDALTLAGVEPTRAQDTEPGRTSIYFTDKNAPF